MGDTKQSIDEKIEGMGDLPSFKERPTSHFKKKYFDVYEIARLTYKIPKKTNLRQEVIGIVGKSIDSKELYYTNTNYAEWIIRGKKLRAVRSGTKGMTTKDIEKYEIIIPNSELMTKTYKRRI